MSFIDRYWRTWGFSKQIKLDDHPENLHKLREEIREINAVIDFYQEAVTTAEDFMPLDIAEYFIQEYKVGLSLAKAERAQILDEIIREDSA